MKSDSAVRIDGVGKKFRLHHRRSTGVKERALARITGHGEEYEDLWALRDVSFSVGRGEMLGLVGANGSGKSTLLQIIAGIYPPDAGTVAVDGRLRALLELGAGFSPDLSGRDNVFLNAALLDFSRAAVRERFDAIVAFAELERFIDMPLKTYSSGMQVRLGFATAVHLDPEVLLLDEVLAVGDDHFQRKCLRRIQDIRAAGTTIVFISHDLFSVEHMCDRVGMLEGGRLVELGVPAEVIAHYRARLAGEHVSQVATRRWGTGEARFAGVTLLDATGASGTVFRNGSPMTIRIEFTSARRIDHPIFGLSIRTATGALITGPNTKMSGYPLPFIEGPGAIEYRIAQLPLLPGVYRLAVAVHDQQFLTEYDHWEGCVEFTVPEDSTAERFGLVRLDASWTLDTQAAATHRDRTA